MISRQTKQKTLIEEEIGRFNSFFTAEELFRAIHQKDKSIGMATIYRSLNVHVHNQKIHNYICNRKTLYSSHSKNHCHFICEKCGKTTHIDIKNIDFLKKNIAGTVCHFQIDVSGVCELCRGNKY